MNAKYFTGGLLLMGLMVGAANTNFITWIVVVGSLQLALLVGALAVFSRGSLNTGDANIAARESTK